MAVGCHHRRYCSTLGAHRRLLLHVHQQSELSPKHCRLCVTTSIRKPREAYAVHMVGKIKIIQCHIAPNV